VQPAAASSLCSLWWCSSSFVLASALVDVVALDVQATAAAVVVVFDIDCALALGASCESGTHRTDEFADLRRTQLAQPT
jgi:hypothetical protein